YSLLGSASYLRGTNDVLFLKRRDHASRCLMFCPWAQHFETLLLGAPLQNVDVDIPRAPAFHLQIGRLVTIDRAGADQRLPLIVDNKFFFSVDDSVPAAMREGLSIRCWGA